MSLHAQPSRLAGSTVTVDMGHGPEPYRLEDWADRVFGGSWSLSSSPVAFDYCLRTDLSGGSLPSDDEVLYGKNAFGFARLVHVSELTQAAKS